MSCPPVKCEGCGETFATQRGASIHRNRWACKSAAERLWEKVDRTGNGCYLWTGRTNGLGYGVLFAQGKTVYAHRFAYELLVGPIPEGLEIDHECGVWNCVRPGSGHCVPKTHAENLCASRQPKEKCTRGHSLGADGDVYVHVDGRRECRTCRRIRARIQRERRQEIIRTGERPPRRLSQNQNDKIYRLIGELNMPFKEAGEHCQALFGIEHWLALDTKRASRFIDFLQSCKLPPAPTILTQREARASLVASEAERLGIPEDLLEVLAGDRVVPRHADELARRREALRASW